MIVQCVIGMIARINGSGLSVKIEPLEKFPSIRYEEIIYKKCENAGLSLLRPMYYEYPEIPEAYTFNKQVCFVFLSDLP